MPLSIIEITSNSGKAMLYAEKCVFYTSAKDGIGRKKTVFLPHIVSVELTDSELVLGTACGEARFIFDNAIDAIAFEEALVSQITSAPTASAVAEHKMRVGEEDFAAALFGGDFDMPQSTAFGNVLDRLDVAEADELLAALQGDTTAYTAEELERIEAALVLKMEM